MKVVLVAAIFALLALANAIPAKTKSPLKTPSGSRSPSPVSAGPAGDQFNITFVVTGKDLKIKNKKSVVDPYLKVFQREGSTQKGTDWKLIGETDYQDDQPNPQWNKVFWFVWKKNTQQVWHFEVKDNDRLSKDKTIGQVDVNVDDFVLKNNQDVTVKIKDGEGSLRIQKTTPFNFRLYARGVPKLDSLGGKSDPFVECYWKSGKTGKETLFYTTQEVKDSENPDWNETIEFSNHMKSAGQVIHFKVYDSDSVSGNDYIGEATMDVDAFVRQRQTKKLTLAKEGKNTKTTLSVTPA